MATEAKQEIKTNAEIIAEQNDQFRSFPFSLGDLNGKWVYTRGVAERGDEFIQKAVQAVEAFNVFTGENDPHGNREFGVFEVEGTKLFWKIDLYDVDYQGGSPDPTNKLVTRRVLTILLPSEY